MRRVRGLSRISLSYNILPLFSADASIYVSFSPSYLGDQYRSEIFYTTPEQKEVAERLIRILKEKGYSVVTDVTPASRFWPAEQYHQNYYNRKGTQPYCHRYTKRF